MGLILNTIIIYFCVMFALYLGIPGGGTPTIVAVIENPLTIFNFTNLFSAGLGLVTGIIAGLIAHDIMTGAVAGMATTMMGWAIIPIELTTMLPSPINLFVTGLLGIMWGIAVLSFFRGYEA